MGIRYSVFEIGYRVLMTSGGLGYGQRLGAPTHFIRALVRHLYALLTHRTYCVDALPPNLLLLYDVIHAPHFSPSFWPRNGEAVQSLRQRTHPSVTHRAPSA